MRGGDLDPDEKDLLEQARGLKDTESRYLDGFLEDIKNKDPRYFDEDGVLKPGSLDWRSGLYVGKMRGTANSGFTDASFEDDPDAEFDWELGGEDHCEDCPRIAALSPFTQDTLFTQPGWGDTECLGNCDCELVRSDGVRGFPRAHLEDGPDAIEDDAIPIESDELAKPDPSSKYLDVDKTTTLSDLESMIQKMDHEVGACFGPDGQLVYAPKVGEESSVSFQPSEIALMKNQDVTFTHNHPGGSCFSDADMLFAANLNLASIRAVGSNGITYVADRPDGGWPDPMEAYRAGQLAYNRIFSAYKKWSIEIEKPGKRLTMAESDAKWAELTLKYMTEGMAKMGIKIEVIK